MAEPTQGKIVAVYRGIIGWSNWRAGCEFYEDTLPEWPRWLPRLRNGVEQDGEKQGRLLTDAMGDPEGARVVVVVLDPGATDQDVQGVEAALDADPTVPLSRVRELVEALELIVNRSIPERNPDGEDQAAESMQLLARDALTRWHADYPEVEDRG